MAVVFRCFANTVRIRCAPSLDLGKYFRQFNPLAIFLTCLIAKNTLQARNKSGPLSMTADYETPVR